MQDVHAGKWNRALQVSGSTLESLHELNSRFLDLVNRQPGGWRSLSQRLAPLSAAQRKAVAGCPYALFDLRFHNDDYWQTRLHVAGHWSVGDDAVSEAQADFVRVALFFAWHVASTARLAASVLLGMSGTTVTAFRRITIDCIPALAAAESANLTERWSNCAGYWAALTRAGARHDPLLLRRVQLSGLQLAAAVQLA